MQWLLSRDQKVKVHSSKAILEMNSTEVQNPQCKLDDTCLCLSQLV